MATWVATRRLGETGSAYFSPVGYYRLGQSYPRSAARDSYPNRIRRWILSSIDSTTTPLYSPQSNVTITTVATVSSQIKWNNIYGTFSTIVDNGGIDYSLNFISSGTPTGITEIYYDNLALTGGSTTLSLSGLNRDILDNTIIINFASGDIKASCFKSTCNSDISLFLNYGNNNHTVSGIIIPPSGSFLSSSTLGWDINASDTIAISSSAITGNLYMSIIGVTG